MKKAHKFFLGGGAILLLAVFVILVWKMKEGFVTKNKPFTKYYCARWMGDANTYGQTGTECGVFKNGKIIENLDGYFFFKFTGPTTQTPVQKCESYSYKSGPQNCKPYKA